MKSNKRRTKYLGTHLQKKLLFIIFASAVIPAAIVAVGMYYIIFSLLAWQITIPELIANNIMPVLHKVNIIIAIAVPVVLLIIWLIAMEISHRIVGPVYRMERELDERIAGVRHGPIILRAKDEFKSLAEKLNKLLK